jgi:hypothetical protein
MAEERTGDKAREYFEIERQERERLLREEQQFARPTTEIVHEKAGGEDAHGGTTRGVESDSKLDRE